MDPTATSLPNKVQPGTAADLLPFSAAAKLPEEINKKICARETERYFLPPTASGHFLPPDGSEGPILSLTQFVPHSLFGEFYPSSKVEVEVRIEVFACRCFSLGKFGEFWTNVAYFWLAWVGCNNYADTKFSKRSKEIANPIHIG